MAQNYQILWTFEQVLHPYPIDFILHAEHIGYQEDEEGRGIYWRQVACIDTIDHVAEQDNHRDKHGISHSAIAPLLYLTILLLAEGKDDHQAAHDHEKLGTLFIEHQIGISDTTHQRHEDGHKHTQGYHQIAQRATINR